MKNNAHYKPLPRPCVYTYIHRTVGKPAAGGNCYASTQSPYRWTLRSCFCFLLLSDFSLLRIFILTKEGLQIFHQNRVHRFAKQQRFSPSLRVTKKKVDHNTQRPYASNYASGAGYCVPSRLLPFAVRISSSKRKPYYAEACLHFTSVFFFTFCFSAIKPQTHTHTHALRRTENVKGLPFPRNLQRSDSRKIPGPLRVKHSSEHAAIRTPTGNIWLNGKPLFARCARVIS